MEKRQKALIEWASSNVKYRASNCSATGHSHYFMNIGGSSVSLRISDHLRLQYSDTFVSVLFNMDGSLCAVHGTQILPLRDLGDAKRFITHLGFLAAVKVGRGADDGFAEYRTLSATEAWRTFRSLSKRKRREALRFMRELARGDGEAPPVLK